MGPVGRPLPTVVLLAMLGSGGAGGGPGAHTLLSEAAGTLGVPRPPGDPAPGQGGRQGGVRQGRWAWPLRSAAPEGLQAGGRDLASG